MRKYERAGIVSVESIIGLIRLDNSHNSVELFGHKVALMSNRIKSLKFNGAKCAACGIEGIYFAVERCEHKLKNERDWHLNIYALTYKLDEVMMTRDHVIPKSKGGSDDYRIISQTLCTHCNRRKADKVVYAETEWSNTGTDIGNSSEEHNLARLCRLA